MDGRLSNYSNFVRKNMSWQQETIYYAQKYICGSQ